MRKSKYLWMEVTADEYELPMCVERTAKGLADKLGMTEDAVHKSVRANYDGRITGRRIKKVAND